MGTAEKAGRAGVLFLASPRARAEPGARAHLALSVVLSKTNFG